MVSEMRQYGFRSLFVLAKIGYNLRDEFADTFDEPPEEVFGSLLEALDDAREVLSLASSEYHWISNDTPFQYMDYRKRSSRSGS